MMIKFIQRHKDTRTVTVKYYNGQKGLSLIFFDTDKIFLFFYYNKY